MTVERFDRWDELSARHAPVLEDAAGASFFRAVPWFEALAATSFEPGDSLRLYAAGDPPALVLPLRQLARRGPLAPRRLTSLANFYSCEFAPLARGDAPRATDVAAIATALRAESPATDLVEVSSVLRPSAAFDAVARGFAEAGWWTQSYFHFANWYEPAEHLDSTAYLAARPPHLRNTVLRKARALERRDDTRVDIVIGDGRLARAALDRAIDAYEEVYRASWKISEPYPRFASAFIRAAAATGALRLGLVSVDGAPAAAQIWLVWRGRATLCKLAHDERFKPLSLGSVLTWQMIRHVLDVDGAHEIDFGRGDDPFKRLWMSHRREHWGVLAFNPATARGLVAAARHLGGRPIARTLRRWRQPAAASEDGASITAGASCTQRRNASNIVSDHSARL